MSIAHWMVISKEPFRFLIAMQQGNHSLTLLRKHQEAAIHFMPWSDRERAVRAGYLNGDFETMVTKELPGISDEFAPFVLDVVEFTEMLTLLKDSRSDSRMNIISQPLMSSGASDGKKMFTGKPTIISSHPNNFITTFCYP